MKKFERLFIVLKPLEILSTQPFTVFNQQSEKMRAGVSVRSFLCLPMPEWYIFFDL